MIDEQTLTFYFYNDGLTEAERETVTRALASDAVLSARYAALKTELDAMTHDAVQAPPEHLPHQWHDLIAREAQLERQQTATPIRRFPWFGVGAAFTAILTLGIAIGMVMQGAPDTPEQGPVIAGTTPEQTTDPATAPLLTSTAFERGLQIYLQESQQELTGMDDRSVDEQALLVMQIVAQNRLFERAAENQQAPEIARLMRAFEPILLRLAATDTAPQDAEALRRQLAFELNAVLTKLQQPASKEAPTI